MEADSKHAILEGQAEEARTAIHSASLHCLHTLSSTPVRQDIEKLQETVQNLQVGVCDSVAPEPRVHKCTGHTERLPGSVYLAAIHDSLAV